MTAADNVFAKIVRGEIPAERVYEDDRALAIRDIQPIAPTHVLVLPKVDLAKLDDAGADQSALLGHLLAVAAEVARLEGVAHSGYRVVINNGPDGGQEVPHLHLHVIGGRRLRGLG